MPETSNDARRRTWWLVALIVFMVALAALYTAVRGRHVHRAGAPEAAVESTPS